MTKDMFFLATIVLVFVAPLAVPVTVSLLHAVMGLRQRVRAARPTFTPAPARAVPAAA